MPDHLRLRHVFGLLTEAIQLAEELAEERVEGLPERGIPDEQALRVAERIQRLKLSAGLIGSPPP